MKKEKKDGIEYNEEQLENIKINIKGLTNEIKKYIVDMEELEFELKEYIYIYGLVDAQSAELKQWDANKDRLQIILELDDINNTYLKIESSLNTNKIDISEI